MKNINFNIDEDIETQFDNIAKKLFNETRIVVNNQEYLFTEIEFYVYNAEKHNDPFVHKDDLQLNSNTWYFHGSGVDITIGNKDTHGGILIRGIKKYNSSEYFDGPLNLLKEIFSNINLLELNQKIGLVISPYIKNDIIKSKRIGIDQSKDQNGSAFFNKKYRYLIDIGEHRHKYKDKEKVIKDHISL